MIDKVMQPFIFFGGFNKNTSVRHWCFLFLFFVGFFLELSLVFFLAPRGLSPASRACSRFLQTFLKSLLAAPDRTLRLLTLGNIESIPKAHPGT